MDSKETAKALELRALATRLAKAGGKWTETDVPSRNILLFEDRDLQIAYREPWPKHKITHHALDVFILGKKVFSVRWKRGDADAEIELYKPGTWEVQLKEFATSIRLRPVK
jgi:hypothetical protein